MVFALPVAPSNDLMSNGPGGEGRGEEELEENGRDMFGPCSGNVQNSEHVLTWGRQGESPNKAWERLRV